MDFVNGDRPTEIEVEDTNQNTNNVTTNNVTTDNSKSFNVSLNDEETANFTATACKLDKFVDGKNCTSYVFEYEESIGKDVYKKNTIDLFIKNTEKEQLDRYITNRLKITNAHKVKQFTEEGRNLTCPIKPVLMNKDRVKFIIRMVFSEMTELAQTVCTSPEETLEFVKQCVGADFNKNYKKPESETELISEQFDAMVDAMYYMYDTAGLHGFNLDKGFTRVHKANMDKKWPDGTFHRRPEDNKIIKPPTWTEPDMVQEVIDQTNNGAW